MTNNYSNAQDLDVSDDLPEVKEEDEMAALGITIKDPEELALGADDVEDAGAALPGATDDLKGDLDEVPLDLGNYDEDEE